MLIETKLLLFDKAGAPNTDTTLQIARERASILGIKQVVVASSHGETARKAYALFAPLNIQLIAVTVCNGWGSVDSKNVNMAADTRAELTRLGVIVHTGVQALGGSLAEGLTGGASVESIVCATLRLFGQGMKVAVECVMMASAAGLLDMAKEVIAIAGTGSGADTAIVCWPANPFNFRHLEIREILCKPRLP